MRPFEQQLVTSNGATNMTGTTTVTSNPMQIGSMSAASIQCIWTGTPTGSWTVQVSNSYDPRRGTGTWSTLVVTNLSTYNPAGAAGDCFIDLTFISSKYVRLQYTNTSGSGSLDVFGFAKGAGA